METLEKLVSDAILQKTSDVITIGDITYEITPPTPATLIMISELVSQLPVVDKNTNNVLLEVLGTAKDMAILGKIVATLILGAKRIKEKRHIVQWSWFRRTKKLEFDYVAERILDEVTNETLVRVVSKRLGMMQIGDFFQVTTFLCEANHLKRTREVETTASGG